MRRIILFLTSFMGVGYIRCLPGTWGALVAWFFFEIINPGKLALILSISLTALAFVAVSLGRGYFSPSENDPQTIVIDEAAAMWLLLSFIPIDTFAVKFLAFGLFRFFDITKPFGIRSLEKIPNNALAIVLDDILAAVYAAATLNLIVWLWLKVF